MHIKVPGLGFHRLSLLHVAIRDPIGNNPKSHRKMITEPEVVCMLSISSSKLPLTGGAGEPQSTGGAGKLPQCHNNSMNTDKVHASNLDWMYAPRLFKVGAKQMYDDNTLSS